MTIISKLGAVIRLPAAIISELGAISTLPAATSSTPEIYLASYAHGSIYAESAVHNLHISKLRTALS